jgi:hypothetical protein
MVRLVVAAELAWRSLTELQHYVTRLRGFLIPGGKTLSVNFAQRADGGVSVFAADFTILVAVAIVETCLLMLSIVPAAESFLPPGPNGN